MINPAKYYLPDIQLLEDKTKRFVIWIPDKTYIVLGASNQAEDALFIENVKQDDVAVLKRPSGGQTVMLTPNNLIIAVVYNDPTSLHSQNIFRDINQQLIAVLEKSGIQNLSLNGISDIAIFGKKILGSAIYRNKDKLLYHAVLNLGEPASTFERYLKHPSREPDYRKGRNHTEFVTSLREKGYSQTYSQLADALSQSLEKSFGALD